MSQGCQIYDQAATYYLTLQVVDLVHIFSGKICRREIIDDLTCCLNSKGLVLYAYVVMANDVHNNPVRAGCVSEPWEWLYFSATNHCGKLLLIEVDFIN